MAKRVQDTQMDLNNGRLETEESFAKVEKYIRSEIENVKANPKVAREYLYKTGMYERNGKVKSEFA